MNFEEALHELETIINKLESGEVPLDETIKLPVTVMLLLTSKVESTVTAFFIRAVPFTTNTSLMLLKEESSDVTVVPDTFIAPDLSKLEAFQVDGRFNQDLFKQYLINFNLTKEDLMEDFDLLFFKDVIANRWVSSLISCIKRQKTELEFI